MEVQEQNAGNKFTLRENDEGREQKAAHVVHKVWKRDRSSRALGLPAIISFRRKGEARGGMCRT